MAFPEVSVLLRFLNDYLEIRESTWHSMSATLVKSGTQLFNSGALVLSKLTSVFVSQDTNHAVKEEELEEEDDEKRIKSICTLLSEAIAKAGKANTLDAWAKVTFDLGEEARKATKRLKRSKISLFSQALHAMRSYAVALLQEEANYPKCTAQFQTQLEGVKTQLYRDRRAGLAIAEFLTQRDKLRLNLADLGNDEAIFECVDAGLFQTLFF
ncbi:MAG TPA: hypothetical protein VLH77_02595, partial [Gammaproteobacteria bacterium]|nr:hypothetical protein [Gammaproteobacteria bacterium]